jgi:hypothetical protein
MAALMILWLFFPHNSTRVLAHGIGTPQQINAPSGPYLVSIWTDPEPLRVNQAHVTVAVMEPETQAPIVNGGQVTVQLQFVVDELISFARVALPDNATNKLFYVATFEGLPHPGQWRMTASVMGPDGPGEDVSFEVAVLPPASFNWQRLGLIGLSLVIAGWIMHSWRQQKTMKKPDASHSRRRRSQLPPRP